MGQVHFGKIGKYNRFKFLCEADYWNLEIEVIRYGISMGGSQRQRKRYSKKSPITFAYLGALIPAKGVHVLIKAFRKLRDPKCRLKIYGIAELRDYFLDLLGLAHGDCRIAFCGPYRILDSVDATCVPSIWPDNYPLVIMEAQARSVPVIGSRIGAIPEAIEDGVNGFLCKPDDPQALYQVMNRIVDNPQLLSAVKRAIPAIRTVEEEAVEFESLYYDMLKKSPIPAKEAVL